MTLKQAKKYLKQLSDYKKYNDDLTPIALPFFNHKKAKEIVRKNLNS